jgi:hypothetical protein
MGSGLNVNWAFAYSVDEDGENVKRSIPFGEALAVLCCFLAAGEEDRVTRAEKVSSFFWMHM